ncbi:antibiotic biosynthesis monooxygenase [Deinococcus taeanensis]|uniref:antibiotic biosynthesis monooxygenase n=1 Tax=Deinococcus taeanensis TaxID=2737050 RepID=UPI001CDCC883|nr:antibiotic biosynthesis monooxygenase [Deinococcus taeanensis]UBV41825.1 antibiotic biosynthesis monooxygenase [Deinococcus taeanensis]
MTHPNPSMTVPSPSTSAPEGVTLVITERVRPSRVEAYEAWARRLHALLAAQPGFLGVHVLRDPAGPLPEYITLLRFTSHAALDAWRLNPAYQDALAQLNQFTASEVEYREAQGLEAWFDRPARLPAPPLWKNMVVGVVGVYPLIMLFATLLRPVTADWPGWAATLATATLSTVFLNWPVLPWLSRLLRPWLYPAPRRG